MSEATLSGIPTFFSAEVAADPPAFYRSLRAEAPVHFDPELNGFLLTRHADVAKAYRDPLFSSQSYERIIEPVFGRSLLQMDGKEHARKRALVTPYFRGKGLDAWQGVIMRNAMAILGEATTGAAEHLASRFKPGQTVNIADEFCNYLPVYVITEMLGLPRDDYPRFKAWYTAHTNFIGAFGTDPEIDRIGREATAADPTARPDLIFETADDYITVGTISDSEWRGFCAAAELPDLAEDSRFDTTGARAGNATERILLMAEILKQRPAAEWLARLDGDAPRFRIGHQ